MFSASRTFPLLALALFLSLTGTAKADVVLLMEDPVNLVGNVTSAGHAALWLERLCSDDHMHMRLCRPGETGSVLSRYPNLNGRMDWLAMDPGQYFYAAETPDAIASTASDASLERLQEAYRLQHQASFPIDPGHSGWVQLTGEAYRRRITLIRVHTSGEQDQRLLNWLSERRNVSHFNIFYSNCADFIAAMLDVLYPGAVHRNLFFDAGMMTPKQLESGLHRYAMHHPELGWQVSEAPQIAGIRRSGHIRGVTKAYLKNWWFLLPLDYLLPYELGAVTTLGLLDHRYTAKSDVEVPVSTFFPPSSLTSDQHPILQPQHAVAASGEM